MTQIDLSPVRAAARSSARGLEQSYRRALDEVIAALGPGWDLAEQGTGSPSFYRLHWTGETLPVQGWKIHVSAAAKEAPALAARVLGWLAGRHASCKIAADVRSIVLINSGEAGITQTGKIITVYPRDDQEAGLLAAELDRRWPASSGPAVPSDLAVRPGGAVFLRYGVFQGTLLVDRLGRSLCALRGPGGKLVEDRRDETGRQPDWAPAPPLPGLRGAGDTTVEAALLHGKRSYLPLALLQASHRGKVFLGLTVPAAREVVLKVVRRGVGGDLEGQAAEHKLRGEHRTLRALARARLAPRPLALLDSLPDRAVLVMEHLEGRPFLQLERAEQIRRLPALARAVARLHAAGFVHRDLKLANVLAAGRSVRLVDFELSARVGAKAPQGCTRGHAAPEREARAATADDLFGLGVCVAQAFGCDPGAVPAGGGRLVGLLHLLRQGDVAHLVRSLVDSDPARRPRAPSAARALQPLCRRTPATAARGGLPVEARPRAGADWCRRAAWEAGLASRAFRQPGPEGAGWRSAQSLGGLPVPAEGLNTGAAGVILGLASIDEACATRTFDEDLETGAAWLACRPPAEEAQGLFTGNAGVALALAVAGKRLRRPDWIAAARVRFRAAIRVEDDCDLFSGLAGVLWTACLLAEVLREQWPLATAVPCARRLAAAAETRDGLRCWPGREPGDVRLTGAAHGSAGIALALAAWSRRVGDAAAGALALATFSTLFEHGRVCGGATLIRTSKRSPAPVLTWCHGIAGYLWCLLLASGDDPRLRREIDWCVERLDATETIGNPVYCHGLAGELELWRMLRGIPRFAQLAARRAARAASALRLLRQRHAGLGAWGSERADVVTPDLWVGFLGPASALALHASGTRAALLSGAWLTACGRARQ